MFDVTLSVYFYGENEALLGFYEQLNDWYHKSEHKNLKEWTTLFSLDECIYIAGEVTDFEKSDDKLVLQCDTNDPLDEVFEEICRKYQLTFVSKAVGACECFWIHHDLEELVFPENFLIDSVQMPNSSLGLMEGYEFFNTKDEVVLWLNSHSDKVHFDSYEKWKQAIEETEDEVWLREFSRD